MIKIVGKGYKYLLQQISDFLEISKTIVISLKSVEGRKKYEKLFRRKLEDKKANPLTRIITTDQSFLTDFINNLFEKPMSLAIVSDYFITKSSKFKIIFMKSAKKNNKEIKSGKRCIISIFQTLLSDFFDDNIIFLKRKINIPYRIRPVIVNSKDYMENVLPQSLIFAFPNFKKFKGYLGNIFTLNPSIDTYFNNVQVSIGYTPQLEISAFNNVFKLEIARCKLGYTNFESFIREYNQNQALRNDLQIRRGEKITLSSYRRNLKKFILIWTNLRKH